MFRSIAIRAPRTSIPEDSVIIPVFRGRRTLPAAAAAADHSLDGLVASLVANGFSGRRGETRLAALKRARRLIRVIVVGMGDRDRCDAEAIADAAGSAAAAIEGNAESTAVIVDDLFDAETGMTAADTLHAIIKGLSLSRYSYSVRSKRREPRARRLVVVTRQSARSLMPAVRRARLITDLVRQVRDWVNAPANRMTPAVFGEQSREVCTSHGVSCRVWGRKEIEKARMGAVLGVSVGSREEPRFVVAEHNAGRTGLPLVCLVGKGVTFDSGGISIKPWEKMHEMKGDMAGGAAVIAAVSAAAAMKLPLRVVGLVPCVENMPGGSAFRPGDVLTTCSGKTIEVLTTDAEGRLILADAVAYAHAHYEPDVIVDMATLTGGTIIALGTRVAAAMGTSAEYVRAIEEAGRHAGEPVWELPIDDYYFAMVKGDISDYKNYAGRGASAITGGAMIGVFAQSTPWVHIDIAGTAWSDGGGASYHARGATGYGVDLLLRFMEGFAAKGA
jgi:leucyl aminopeptidase